MDAVKGNLHKGRCLVLNRAPLCIAMNTRILRRARHASARLRAVQEERDANRAAYTSPHVGISSISSMVATVMWQLPGISF